VITHIHSATLLVEDQDAALDFYVGKLGWEKRADAAYGDRARWVEVGPPGAVTTLALVKPSDVAAPSEETGKYKGISLVTDDIGSTYGTLSDRGSSSSSHRRRCPGVRGRRGSKTPTATSSSWSRVDADWQEGCGR